MSNLACSSLRFKSSEQVGELLFHKFGPLQKGALLISKRSLWVSFALPRYRDISLEREIEESLTRNLHLVPLGDDL